MWPNPHGFTEEILNGKLHFLCSELKHTYFVQVDLPPLCTIIFSQKLRINLVDHNYITALETKEAHMVTWSQGRFRLNSQTIFSLPLGLGGDK